MDHSLVYDKINGLLEDTDYPMEIRDISDLEDFLNDEGNMELESYDEIVRLYNKLMDEPELDE